LIENPPKGWAKKESKKKWEEREREGGRREGEARQLN